VSQNRALLQKQHRKVHCLLSLYKMHFSIAFVPVEMVMCQWSIKSCKISLFVEPLYLPHLVAVFFLQTPWFPQLQAKLLGFYAFAAFLAYFVSIFAVAALTVTLLFKSSEVFNFA
jgi:hypothetical protein